MFRKITVSLLLATMLAACSGGTGRPVVVPTTVSAVAISFARAGARIAIDQTLAKKGVSSEDRAALLAELHVIADAVLIGKDGHYLTAEQLRVVLADPATWEPLRGRLVVNLGKVFTKARVGGVQVYDQSSAESFAGSLIDTFEAVVGKPAPAAPSTVGA